MLVYRVEHTSCKEGPYNGSYNCSNKFGDRHLDSEHPNFYNDSVFRYLISSDNYEKYYFGFISLDQLFTWFDEEDIKILKESSFVVRIYETQDFLASAYQCVFLLCASKLVDEMEF